MQIPNWLLKTKKVDNEFCKLNYIDTLDNKLGILPFLSLEELREELKEHNITTRKQYKKYRKENNKINWPANPDRFYNIKWRELFGKIKKEFLSLEELIQELKKHNIKTRLQYTKYRKENNKINWPFNPYEYYNITFEELFGKTKKVFLSLEKLQEELRLRGIKTSSEYMKYREINWPSDPCGYYDISWRQIFGKKFLSLEELQEELKLCEIKSQKEYVKYRKEHNKINWPSCPEPYGISWKELFSKKKVFLSFEKLKEELILCGIRSQPEYKKYRKEHNKINWPYHPARYYDVDFYDFFSKKKVFLSLEELQEELRTHEIKTLPKYMKYRKEHNKINWPSDPCGYYDIIWRQLFEKELLSLKQLKEELVICGVETRSEYIAYRKEYDKINWPSDPIQHYNISSKEIFKIKKIKKEFLSLEQLQEELRIYGIKSASEYLKYRKENNKINWPFNPNKHYNAKCTELFGKTKLSLEELREELKKHNITTQKQYRKYRKENNKINWPAAADEYYNIKWRELFGK